MAEYIIKNKKQLFSIFMNLNIHIELDNVKTTEDLFDKIEKKDDKELILNNLIQYLLSRHIITHLNISEQEIKNADIQPYMNKLISIPRKEKLKFPIAIITNKSLTLLGFLFVIYAGLLAIYFLNNPLVLLALLDVKLNLIMLFLPLGAIFALLPNIFFSKIYMNCKTFDDLIKSLYFLNRRRYSDNNYSRLKDEIIGSTKNKSITI